MPYKTSCTTAFLASLMFPTLVLSQDLSQEVDPSPTPPAVTPPAVTPPALASPALAPPAPPPPGITLKGDASLSYNTALGNSRVPGTSAFDDLSLRAIIQWENGPWKVVATPSFRLSPVGGANTHAYLYVGQVQGAFHHGLGDIKAGKIPAHFGRGADYGNYGSLIAQNAVKMQSDLGLSAEGSPELYQDFKLGYAVQYFPWDGRAFDLSATSPFSLQKVKRRNVAVVRMAPKFQLTPDSSVTVGLSGERFDATVLDGHQVLRAAADVDATYGPVQTFVEVGQQHDTAMPVHKTTRLVGTHRYLWTGAMLTFDNFNVHYNFNAVRYQDNPRTVELLHQPGIALTVNDNLTLAGELAWTTNNDTSTASADDLERSFSLIAMGHF